MRSWRSRISRSERLAGYTPFRAAMEGADAIGLAVLATTASIVVVFLPTSFMGGMPGQFFIEFGIDGLPWPSSSRCCGRAICIAVDGRVLPQAVQGATMAMRASCRPSTRTR